MMRSLFLLVLLPMIAATAPPEIEPVRLGRDSTAAIRAEARLMASSGVWAVREPAPGSVFGLRRQAILQHEQAAGRRTMAIDREWADYYQALTRVNGRLPLSATNTPAVKDLP